MGGVFGDLCLEGGNRFCHWEPDIDCAWDIWCGAAEGGLLSACKAAGGPCPQGDRPFFGRRAAVIRSRLVGGLVGGGCIGRLVLMRWTLSHTFINSSLAPVILFVRQLFKRHLEQRFSTARCKLWWHVGLQCRQGPTAPTSTLEPWEDELSKDLHGFYKWVFGPIEDLNHFVYRLVVARRERERERERERVLQSWKRWLDEDLSSGPYLWLRPDLVPLAPYSICPLHQTRSGSGVQVQPALVDAQFWKAWMPLFFGR